MTASKLKLGALIVGLTAILCCAWLKPLDNSAMQRVDEGLKRATISFGTARLIGAGIAVVESIEVSGIVVKFAPGKLLHPLGKLVGQFADLMLAATIVFAAMKVLLVIGGSTSMSLFVTAITMTWVWYICRGAGPPNWLSKLLIVVMLIRFAVPIVMVGSDLVYKSFMANQYISNQETLAKASKSIPPNPLNVLVGIPAQIKEFIDTISHVTDYIVRLIVVFLLQTLVIPIFFFWALYRVLMSIFQTPATQRINSTGAVSIINK